MKRDQEGSDRRRRVAFAMTMLLSLVSFARASAQEITVALGDGSTIGAPPRDTVVVPMNVRFAAGSSENLASLAFSVTWDTARLVYDTVIAAAANVTFNTNAVSNGRLDGVWFAATGETSDFSVMALRFTARATSGFTGVNVSVSTAGNETGQSILDKVEIRALGVCVGTGAVLGDVNDDGEIDIIDAQQIARFSVGLSVTNPEVVGVRGDVNKDGAANIIDAQQVARYVVGLEITSAVGEQAGSVCTGPPAVTITAPEDSSAFASGQAITFQGSAADPEDGALGGSNLTWSSSLDGQFGTGSTVTTGALSAGDHAITLTATDGDGNTESATVNISVGTALGLHLVFTHQPSSVPVERAVFPVGYPIYPSVEVEVRNAAGDCASDYTGSVSLTLGANPGGALSGGGPVSPTGCTYSFPDLFIGPVGHGYTLVAASDGVPPVASDPFRVSIAGDLDVTGLVDTLDVETLQASWGAIDYPPADINKDGQVDIVDLGILLSNWTSVLTGSASDVTTSSASLNGWVAAPVAVNAWFEWGTDSTLNSYFTTPPTALPAGDSVPVSASLGGLASDQTYYFRLVAEQEGNTLRSQIANFSTQPAACVPGNGPTVLASSARGATGSPPSYLYTVELSKCGRDVQVSEIVRDDGATPDVLDIAYSPNGELWGVLADIYTESQLARIDPGTGTARPVGQIGMSGVAGIAFQSPAVLYGAQWVYLTSSASLIQIDTLNAHAQVIGQFGVGGSDGALAFSSTGTLYAVVRVGSRDYLAVIDPGSGAATLVNPDNPIGSNVTGIVFFNGTLYGLATNRTLIEISTDTGIGAHVRDLDFTPSGVAREP